MCYQIAVGKNATADGSVLVARSCDSNSAVAIRIISVPRMKHDKTETIKFPSGVEIPQAKETSSYVTTAQFTQGVSIELTMGGVNEHQVSAGSSSGDHCLKEEVKKVSPRHPTAIGDYRMTLALQRAKTAREAIKIMADLTEKYGARTDNYVLADPNEAWLWEEFQDRRWIAVRVPDDSFVVEANNRRIANIDLEDTENYMGSKDIIDFAVEHGFYDPDGGEPFSCAKVYSNRGTHLKFGEAWPKLNTRRIWRGISLLAPSTKLDPEADYYPLFVKPDRKLTPKDLLNVMRDHYQGTKYDLYAENWEQYKHSTTHLNENLQYQLSPSWQRERRCSLY